MKTQKAELEAILKALAAEPEKFRPEWFGKIAQAVIALDERITKLEPEKG